MLINSKECLVMWGMGEMISIKERGRCATNPLSSEARVVALSIEWID